MLLLVIVMKNMFKMNEDTYIITVFFRLGIKEAISLSLSLSPLSPVDKLSKVTFDLGPETLL